MSVAVSLVALHRESHAHKIDIFGHTTTEGDKTMVTSSTNATNSTALRKKCRPAMDKRSPYKSKSSRLRTPSKLAAAAAAAKSCHAGKTTVEAASQTRRKTPTRREEMRLEARAKAKAWAKANRDRRGQSTGTPERKVKEEVIVLGESDDDDDANRQNAKEPESLQKGMDELELANQAKDDDTDYEFFDALEQEPLEPEEVKVPTEPRKEVEVGADGILRTGFRWLLGPLAGARSLSGSPCRAGAEPVELCRASPTEPRKKVEVEEASDDEFAEMSELRNQRPSEGESWMEPARGLDPAGTSFSTFPAKMDP
mmetsp:Transcript_25709/g.58018  ORF Transcript_25709/g.58018 Transcript_25709/m.58018 type:complete len:312 (+) Transcript_25709:404-1339(+)